MQISDCAAVLGRVKVQVRAAQLRAQRVVNTELVMLYWTIGEELLHQQGSPSWGSDVVGRLADDLRAEFPSMEGFPRSNLAYMMRAFAVTGRTGTQFSLSSDRSRRGA